MELAMAEKSEGNTLVKFQISRLDNNTFLATLVTSANSSGLHGDNGYDDEGALYYVVAVVFIYGFSIILMIGSLIKRNKGDNGVSKYMKDMDKVHRLERRQKKYQTRLAMSAAGSSRRASRALAARGVNVELGLKLAPPMGGSSGGRDAEAEFSCADVDPTSGNDLITALTPTQGPNVIAITASPRLLPLHGRPPPGRAVQLSPRHGGHSILADLALKLQPQREESNTSNITFEVDDMHADALLAPVHNIGGVIVQEAGDGVSDCDSTPSVGGAAACSTMLYIENEKDNKCKVTIVPQVQLGTVHEVDEEQHACSQDNNQYGNNNVNINTSTDYSTVVHV